MGEHQPAVAERAARRTRSCRRRARAPPRSSRPCCRAPRGRRPCGRRGSRLARRAPVGRAVVVALAAGADRRAAAAAGQPGAVVDPASRSREAARRPTPASAGGPRGRPRAPRRRTPPQPPPRVDPGEEAALGLPDVPDAGDVALVEQRVADAARLVVLAQAAEEAALVELLARARRGRASRAAGRSACGRRSSAPAPVRRTATTSWSRGADHEPGPVRRAAPALPAPIDAPLAGHAQVRVQRQAALEADEQVLAVGVDRRAPRARRAARASDPARGGDAASRSTRSACRPARRPRAAPPSGSCRPRARLAEAGGAGGGRARSEYISGSRGPPSGIRRTPSRSSRSGQRGGQREVVLVQQLEHEPGVDHGRDDVGERVLPLLGAVVHGLRVEVRVGPRVVEDERLALEVVALDGEVVVGEDPLDRVELGQVQEAARRQQAADQLRPAMQVGEPVRGRRCRCRPRRSGVRRARPARRRATRRRRRRRSPRPRRATGRRPPPARRSRAPSPRPRGAPTRACRGRSGTAGARSERPATSPTSSITNGSSELRPALKPSTS